MERLKEYMHKHNLTEEEALKALRDYVNDKQFYKALDETYNNRVHDMWDYWHDGDI